MMHKNSQRAKEITRTRKQMRRMKYAVPAERSYGN